MTTRLVRRAEVSNHSGRTGTPPGFAIFVTRDAADGHFVAAGTTTPGFGATRTV